MTVGTVAIGLIGLGVGMIIGVFILAAVQENRKECLVGQAILEPAGVAIQFGEAVVCGDEIIISNIHGPTIEAWEGDIQFYHNHD